MSLIAREHILIKPGDYVTEAKFFSVKSLPKLAFDHKKIIQYAMQRLRWKFEYSNVAQYILPKKFTLSELQKVYEMVLEQQIDVRNFRKKIDKLGIIRPTGEKEIGVKYRPAQLFEFVDKKFKIVEMI
jgi:8-oxo-dGTP diphosphatase